MERIDGHREFLTFRLCDEEYAIDILQVREIRANEPVTRIAQAPRYVRGVINLRGTIVPIVDLRARFGLPAADAATLVTIIVCVDERLTGLVVDAVSDVAAVPPDQVRPAPTLRSAVDTTFIEGIALLDGRMLIVADVAALAGAEAQAQREAA